MMDRLLDMRTHRSRDCSSGVLSSFMLILRRLSKNGSIGFSNFLQLTLLFYLASL